MNNYKLEIKDDTGMVLDPDTLCPMRKLDIILKVRCEAQHDGHPWTERDIRLAENELIEKIMNKLRIAVAGLVNKADTWLLASFPSKSIK